MKNSEQVPALSRRDLLRRSGAVALGSVALAGVDGAALAQEARPSRRGKKPRNIVFMIADGMSMGTLALAEPFSHLVRERGTAWHTLLRRREVSHGYYETASLNSLVTDSSAASSAFGTGTRIVNNAINQLPDGTKLTPIGPLVKEAGRRFGLVTTATVTHATPAGFAAVQPHRDQEEQIAPQYLDLADVLLGGGRKFFAGKSRKDRRDLLEVFRTRGYAVCETRNDLLAANDRSKLLGLFHDSHLPYTVDQRHSPQLTERVPTLAEMTRAALSALHESRGGFLLQVEGARVDHAAHMNDPAAILWEQLAFDDAVAVVLEFAARNPETLVVITSDHGNANPGLNGMGERYDRSDPAFRRLARVTGSYGAVADRLKACGPQPTTEAVLEAVREILQVELTQSEAERLRLAAGGRTPDSINRSLANLNGVLGQTLSNHFGIGWVGTAHTADLVPVTAIGPGQERFAHLGPNTDAFVQVAGLFGIQHRNPTMSPEEARRLQRAELPPTRPHWV